VGASHLRQLRRDGQTVRQQRRRQEKAAAGVRKRLAQGLKLDTDDDTQAEGLDLVYARDITAKASEKGDDDGRGDVAFAAAAGSLPKGLVKKIGELVLSDEAARVVAGAKLIEALERVDPALTKRIEPHVLAEAHEIIDIVESDIDWSEAVRLARESIDVAAGEREQRSQRFAEQSDPGWVGRTLDETLGVKIGGVKDGATADAPRR
jgi:hypothetical protein